MTDPAGFEKLCCDLLADYGGYDGVIPQGVGRKDGGKDAIYFVQTLGDEGERRAIVFHFSLRKDVSTKIKSDLAATAALDLVVERMVFVSSRRIGPGVRDSLQEFAKDTYGFDLEVLDQDWLRVPLDGQYQRVRQTYLGIDFDENTFLPIAIVLSNPLRHPNFNDFRSETFVRRVGLEDRLSRRLNKSRVALLGGRPGHGKTGVALGLGDRLLAESPSNLVFYLSAKTNADPSDWLRHVRAMDYPNATFIIDDCHIAIEATNTFVAQLPLIARARVLIVYRTIDPAETGPAEESFLDALADVATIMNPDRHQMMAIMAAALATRRAHQATGDELWATAKLTQGDLHLLSYVIAAWLAGPVEQPLSAVDFNSVLGQIYRRYLARAPIQEAICSLCVLSQYEIPMEARWFGDRAAIRQIKSDAFVESSIKAPRGEPIDMLYYFHSTPARLILSSAHRAGILNGVSVDRFILTETLRYLRSSPQNFFDVFQGLHVGGHRKLLTDLYTTTELVEFAATQIALLPDDPPDETIKAVASYVIGLSYSDIPGARAKCVEVLRQFVSRYVGTLGQLLERLSTRTVALLLVCAMISPEFGARIIPLLDFGAYGAKAHDGGVKSIAMFIRRAVQLRIDRTQIRAFCDALDLVKLRDSASEGNFPAVCDLLVEARKALHDDDLVIRLTNSFDFAVLAKGAKIRLSDALNFLTVAAKIGFPPARVNYVLRAANLMLARYDCKSASAETLIAYCKAAVAAGVERAVTNDLWKNCDLAQLIVRASNVAIAVEAFGSARKSGFLRAKLDAALVRVLELAAQETHVDDLLMLVRYLSSLDPDDEVAALLWERVNRWNWKRIGYAVGRPTGAQLVRGFQTVGTLDKLTPRSAALFLQGVTAPTLVRLINSGASPDVMAAIAKLLELAGDGDEEREPISLKVDDGQFLSSFRTRAPMWLGEEFNDIQKSLLRDAFERVENREAADWTATSTWLRQYNITLRSLLQVDTPKSVEIARAIFSNREQVKLDGLLSTATLFDLSKWLSHFINPAFYDVEKPHLPDEFDTVGLSAKIAVSDLSILARLLFDPRSAGRSSWIITLADFILDQPSALTPLVAKAPPNLIGFFLWNLWSTECDIDRLRTATNEWQAPIAISMQRDHLDVEGALMIAGTLNLIGLPVPEAVGDKIRPVDAFHFANESTLDATPTLIRVLSGIRASGIPMTKYQRARYAAALRNLELTIDIPRVAAGVDGLIVWLDEEPEDGAPGGL